MMLEQTDNRKFGAFQKMGFSKELLKSILSLGYRVPTPIQRKIIPLVIHGKDTIAMSRTGSGKTAAFLIPLAHMLLEHNEDGPRALILSPTKDLSIQTYQFAKRLLKFSNLVCSLIVGGESIESQFSKMHNNPDIIIATPGRFLHLLIEMGMKMDMIKHLILDEADRLFELGFSEQIHDILKLIPKSRQIVLVSATIPQSLVSFSGTGMDHPELVKLDTELTLSPNLKTAYLFTKNEEDKISILLYLLDDILLDQDQKTMIFVPTMYHVEFLKEVLERICIKCSVAYSKMDDEARKLNIQKFRQGEAAVMVATDIACRGLDIPILDNVINFDFPSNPKIFVHRAGRVARIGRTGTAYSFFTRSEMHHLLELHSFMSENINFTSTSEYTLESIENKRNQDIESKSNVFGFTESNISSDCPNLKNESTSNKDLQNNKTYEPTSSIIENKHLIENWPSKMIGAVPASAIGLFKDVLSDLSKRWVEYGTFKKRLTLAKKKADKFNFKNAPSASAEKFLANIDLNNLGFHKMFKVLQSDVISQQVMFSKHIRMNTNINGLNLEKVMKARDEMQKIADKIKKKEDKKMDNNDSNELYFKGKYNNNDIAKDIFYNTNNDKYTSISLDSKKVNSKFYDPNFVKVSNISGSNSFDLKKSIEMELTDAAFEIKNDEDLEFEKSIDPSARKRRIWDKKKNKFIRKNHISDGAKLVFDSDTGINVKKSFKTDKYKKWLRNSGRSGDVDESYETNSSVLFNKTKFSPDKGKKFKSSRTNGSKSIDVNKNLVKKKHAGKNNNTGVKYRKNNVNSKAKSFKSGKKPSYKKKSR